MGRESFFSIENKEKQPKTKWFAKNKVVAVSVAVGAFVRCLLRVPLVGVG